MRKIAPASLFALSLALLSPPAWAGQPQDRQGFWIGFGGGYGSALGRADCADCGGDRQGSVTGFLKLGGTLSQNLLLGVETNAWTRKEEGVRVTIGSLTGTVTVYPQATGGFFLKGGVGASYVDTSSQIGSVDVSVSKTGWGLLAGLGYDVRIGRNVSLTPCVNYIYGKPGNLVFDAEDVLPGWKQDVISFELGLTFH